MSYRINIKQFSNFIKKFGERAELAIIDGLQESSLYLEGMIAEEIENAKPRPAVNTGALKRSIKSENTNIGAVVSVDAPHAPYVEHGTRPHFPPIEPLKNWVRQKGIATEENEVESIAFSIARHISVHGTRPRFFMKRAVGKLYSKRILDRFIIPKLDKIKP